ncbi:hypothetical protein K488DRAFT_45222 [Vararia minispora EC-137]|uniref:Uncharacterized protein n=1 Tax=Vararia minispora EC-137 TaxID=1314806 RepID=A0ACB8QS01_9AGAM|nr:hypothetical protein K488DRAFT_45222 [Vararia minispora EC-137]
MIASLSNSESGILQSIERGADIVLHTLDQRKFQAHKCILSQASSFFESTFTLPQADITFLADGLRVIHLNEPGTVWESLLQLIYPVPDPELTSLDQVVTLLAIADKYEMDGVTDRLRHSLAAPAFLSSAPMRVYAIAARFGFTEEARLASSHTLGMHILDYDVCPDMREITVDMYHRLLQLHRRRGLAARDKLVFGDGVRCVQCNPGSALAATFGTPRWWSVFKTRAAAELAERPTTAVVFSMKFLVECARESRCPQCPGSVLESYAFLERLKADIDSLPDTI